MKEKKRKMEMEIISTRKINELRTALLMLPSNDPPILFLHGPSGCGKTTLLEKLATELQIELIQMEKYINNLQPLEFKFKGSKDHNSTALKRTFVHILLGACNSSIQTEISIIYKKTKRPVVVELEEDPPRPGKNKDMAIRVSIPATTETKLSELLSSYSIKRTNEYNEYIASIIEESQRNAAKAIKTFEFWKDHQREFTAAAQATPSNIFHLVGKIIYPKEKNIPILLSQMERTAISFQTIIRLTKITKILTAINEIANLLNGLCSLEGNCEYYPLYGVLKIFHTIKNCKSHIRRHGIDKESFETNNTRRTDQVIKWTTINTADKFYFDMLCSKYNND